MNIPRPSRKQKRRYALLSFDREDMSYEDMKNAVLEAYTDLFGKIGLSHARLMFLKYDVQAGNSLIIRVNLNHMEDLRAAILCIDSIKRKTVSARIMLVSGTLKSLRGKLFKPSSAP